MNQEVKKAWLEALRSGNYKQGQSWLKDGDKYCCLGVLCETLSRKPELGFKVDLMEDECSSSFVYGDEDECEVLPSNLRKELGINPEDQGRAR